MREPQDLGKYQTHVIFGKRFVGGIVDDTGNWLVQVCEVYASK